MISPYDGEIDEIKKSISELEKTNDLSSILLAKNDLLYLIKKRELYYLDKLK